MSLPTETQAQRKLILDGSSDDYNVTPYLEVLEDKDCKLTINDVCSPESSTLFKSTAEVPLNPGISRSVWWTRFQLVDSAHNGIHWVLDVDYPGISQVDLFIVDSANRVVSKHGGSLVPFNRREIKDRRTIFRLGAQGSIGQMLYVRFQSQSSIVLTMHVRNLQRYMVADHDAQFYLGGFYGSVLILILYNLFLFLAVRDSTYLFYVLYIAGYVFHQLVVDGLFEEYFFPNSVVNAVPIFQMAIGWFLVFGSLFTQRILSSRKFSPFLHKALMLCVVFGGLIFVLSPVVSGQVMNRLLSVVLISYALIGAALAILDLRIGYTPARFYLLAVTGFLVGLSVRVLRVAGVLPLNYLTDYAFQIGMLWEMTLFSFALGDRINSIKVEQERERGEMRSRIAGDLHDEIGSNLSSILLASQMIQRTAPLDERAKNQLGEISTTAKETTDAIRDIVWFINPQHDTLADLVLRLKDVTPKLLMSIEYTFNTSGPEIRAMPDLLRRKEIYLFYKEALNNIVKHANASKVEIEIGSHGNEFVLTICDDGVGFEAAHVTEGFGLKNLRDRAEKVGAKFELSSCRGEGTRITLCVPLR